jgi:hypothetical protein
VHPRGTALNAHMRMCQLQTFIHHMVQKTDINAIRAYYEGETDTRGD